MTLNTNDVDSVVREFDDLIADLDGNELCTRIKRIRDQLDGILSTNATMMGERPALTRREIDVLRGVADGLTNRDVGVGLGLAEDTVKTYMKTATRKLDVRNRVQAIAVARELGLIN